MVGRGAVVVTGASSGIGWATTIVLARRGWPVFAGVRREEDGATLVAAAGAVGVGGLVRPVILDVTDPASVAAAAAAIGEALPGHGGRLTGLVNNAGIAVAGPVEELPIARLREVLEINVIGAVAVAQALLPPLRRGRGRIVNVGSISGRIAPPFLGAYAASKFALAALSDALRVELSPWGLRVILIEPGPVATPIWGKGAAMAEIDRAAIGNYSQYMRYVARARARFGDGQRRGVAPGVVARVIADALATPRPRARYLVARNGMAIAGIARLAPDWLRDWLLTGGEA